LDNAGKTTILKRFNGEEIDTISPTLGFNIKTFEHRGYYILCDFVSVVKMPLKETFQSHTRHQAELF
jgi:GTPase SAR1 family protein